VIRLLSNDTFAVIMNAIASIYRVKVLVDLIENAVSDISDKCETFIPTDSIDLTPIIMKLERQDEKLQKEIGKLKGMLNNERFVANAPEDVLAKNRGLLADAEAKRVKVLEQLNSLKS